VVSHANLAKPHPYTGLVVFIMVTDNADSRAAEVHVSCEASMLQKFHSPACGSLERFPLS